MLAAEAAGRKGDFDKAAEYINVIRKRAAWAEGEQKDQADLAFRRWGERYEEYV